MPGMGLNSFQRGFVHSRLLDLAFLFVLILLGIGAWQWLSTVVAGDFMLAWFMVWLMATAIAWWWTREQILVLRLPIGFLLYLVLGLLLVPLSWWSGSKLVAASEAVVLTVGARYFGALGSAKLKTRIEQGNAPWWLDQSIDLIADLARWIAVCIVAWFTVSLLPMVFVFVLPLEWIAWAAMVWGFGLAAWYLYKVRKSRVRLFKVPLGLWVFVLTAVVLQLFQKQLVGLMEAGSIEQIAYAAWWPVLAGMFIEIVVWGTERK